jgi:hypothetical protein
MKKHSLAAAGLVWLLAGSPAGAQAPIPAPGIDNEPVVTYDVSGATFAGRFHLHLAVYTSGLASISKKTALDPTDRGAADFTFVPVEAVRALHAELKAAGAGTLPDFPGPVFDAPTRTVTYFMDPGPRAATNTFSYQRVLRGYAQVDQLLRRFICAHFRGFETCVTPLP